GAPARRHLSLHDALPICRRRRKAFMSTAPVAGAPTRIQQNILARGERRLLNWICPRLPAWVTPDQLTTLGFIGAIMVAAGYMLRSEEHTSELQSREKLVC